MENVYVGEKNGFWKFLLLENQPVWDCCFLRRFLKFPVACLKSSKVHVIVVFLIKTHSCAVRFPTSANLVERSLIYIGVVL